MDGKQSETLKEKAEEITEAQKLEAFRKEIKDFAEHEAEHETTGDFEGVEFKPNDLTKDDFEIWKKIAEGTITTKDFTAYRDNFNKEKGGKNPTRMGFMSLAGNKATEFMGKLEMFRKEMEEFAAHELELRKTGHFKNVVFDPNALTGRDLRIWEKIVGGTVTMQDFADYRKKIAEERGVQNSTRAGFMSLVSNKAAAIIGRQYLEKTKEAKTKK